MTTKANFYAFFKPHGSATSLSCYVIPAEDLQPEPLREARRNIEQNHPGQFIEIQPVYADSLSEAQSLRAQQYTRLPNTQSFESLSRRTRAA